MAQLRLKLPREALANLAGLQCPEEAWARLEESYGNRVLSILAAIKALREFRPKTGPAHEQVIEVAMAVQKCVTILKNIDALHELLGDRESVACIIQALPSTVRDKWYDKEVPDDTCKMGEVLLAWIETQRLNAVRVRMDVMAARMRAPSTTPSRQPTSSESTDKGLLSNSLHTQGDVKPAVDKKDGAGESRAVRIEVKTSADAQQVADRRRISLEKRKLEKCRV